MLLRVQDVVRTARAMTNSCDAGCPEAICGRLVQSTLALGMALRDGCDLSARAERYASADGARPPRREDFSDLLASVLPDARWTKSASFCFPLDSCQHSPCYTAGLLPEHLLAPEARSPAAACLQLTISQREQHL